MDTISFIEAIPNPFGPKRKLTKKAMWAKLLEYLQWCHDNPLYEVKPMVVAGPKGEGSSIEEARVPKVRMATIDGYCLFAAISVPNFYNYRSGEHANGEYVEICELIVKTINEVRTQQAAADFLNATFVAKLMGMADKVVNINSEEMTKDEILEISKVLDEQV